MKNNEELNEEIKDEVKTEGKGETPAAQPEESYYDRIRRIQNEEKKAPKKLRKRDIVFIAVAVFLAVGALVFANSFTEEQSWKTVSGTGKQYYMGGSSAIRTDTKLRVDESGRVISQNEVERIAEVPIYLDEKTAFILTEDMVYYDPRAAVNSRADALTEFTVGENGNIYAVKDEIKKRVSTGFLYNGADMYIFLEPMTLEVNDYTVRVPALSYVEAVNGEQVVIFNYETKESETFVPETGVTATPEDGAYSVLLLDDAWIRGDGKRILLFFAPEKLDPLI